MELKQYWLMIKKRFWIIAATVILATLTSAVISTYVLKPAYQASTKLIVNLSKDSPNAQRSLDYNLVNMNLKLIDTYKEIIKSPAIMDKVVSQYPDLHMSSDALSKKIKVSSVNNTQVMTVVAEDLSYDRAVLVVNAVSKVFQKEILSIMNVDNVSILNEAQLKDRPSPVKPKSALIIAISFAVSLMAAVGIVFLLDYLDDTLKSEEDIRVILELPTLAVIARLRKEDLSPKVTARNERTVGETTYAAANN